MAKNKIEKTNAARLLDRAGIAYELIPYTVDETNLAAAHVAEELGEDIVTVFKTLVLCGDKTGYLVCVVPGDHEVDLKAAAKISGNKRVEMLHMKRRFPTYIHESCLRHDAIYVSAGVRGLQIRVAPRDLVAFTDAAVADISRPMGE